MTGLYLSPFTAESRSETLQRLLALAGLEGARPEKAPSGKPYLKAPGGAAHGLAITHLRKASPPFALMAVAENPLIGLDAELWPQGPGDAAFLQAVAAPGEEALITRLAATGRDPGVFLWTLKEAALKASGEVMSDPRDISVEPSINGHFWAATSATSQRPVHASHVRICCFSAKAGGPLALLAVAISGLGAEALRRQPIAIAAPGLALDAPF